MAHNVFGMTAREQLPNATTPVSAAHDKPNSAALIPGEFSRFAEGQAGRVAAVVGNKDALVHEPNLLRLLSANLIVPASDRRLSADDLASEYAKAALCTMARSVEIHHLMKKFATLVIRAWQENGKLTVLAAISADHGVR